MTTLQEKIAVMQAFADGKTIQVCLQGKPQDAGDCISPSWNWDMYEYMVKREPREWWVNVYGERNMYAYESKAVADEYSSGGRIDCIHVREVID